MYSRSYIMAVGKWTSLLICAFLAVSLNEISAKPKSTGELDYETNNHSPDLTISSEDSVKVNSDGMIQVDDMILTPEQYNTIQENEDFHRVEGEEQLIRHKRKAANNESYLWPDGVVPYKIASNCFSERYKLTIRNAMDEWQNYSCLVFREATEADTTFYTTIKKGKKCYSDIGWNNTLHEIILGEHCGSGTIMHELAHAVGLVHEQNRPDRDKYVTIVEDNIEEDGKRNFWLVNSSLINTFNIPYDYESLMHYDQFAFAKNESLPTIITKDPKYQNVIGTLKVPTFYDVKILNLLYKCGQHCPKMSCPDDGFVGKDCRCWCKGKPIQLCDVPSEGQVYLQLKLNSTIFKDIDINGLLNIKISEPTENSNP